MKIGTPSQACILLVEDDPDMSRGIADNLQIDGYEVVTATRLAEARTLLRRMQPDLLLLDRMLPDGDGIEFCRDARESGFIRPIIMLTAKGEEMDRVVGLESGADDYIVKPFSLRELLARVRAHLRRSNHWNEPDDWVTVGAARVDFKRHRLERDGTEIETSAREFELLRYLVARRGLVVSRDALLENVWGMPSAIETRTVDNFIVRLRRKIELDPSNPRHLVTIHGSGYKLLPE